MRISDWSSDVCSSDLVIGSVFADTIQGGSGHDTLTGGGVIDTAVFSGSIDGYSITVNDNRVVVSDQVGGDGTDKLSDFSFLRFSDARLKEHTSALQSILRNTYAVLCLQKLTKQKY